MNPKIIELVDWALQTALWAFLAFLVLGLAFVFFQIRRRGKKSLGPDRLREQEEKTGRAGIPTGVGLKAGFRASLFALASAVIIFLALLFFPLPGLDNFASGSSWQQTPLRVTALEEDRFYEGFSVEGEVWNQTPRPLEDVTLFVDILGTDEEVLDEVRVSLNPDPVPAGRPASFRFEYRDNSPFLTGYRLVFRDAEDNRVAHVTGFDVR